MWLGGLCHYLHDTSDAFAHAIALSAVAIHSALSEHIGGTHETVDFSPTNTESIYDNILTSLLALPSLASLKANLALWGDSLIGIAQGVPV